MHSVQAVHRRHDFTALRVQGFVSNKDTDTTGERGDPIEGLLYAIFVASTDRADVASLVGRDRHSCGDLHDRGGLQRYIICRTTTSHVGSARPGLMSDKY